MKESLVHEVTVKLVGLRTCREKKIHKPRYLPEAHTPYEDTALANSDHTHVRTNHTYAQDTLTHESHLRILDHTNVGRQKSL